MNEIYKRTPKGYDNTKPTTKTMQDILPFVMEKIRLKYEKNLKALVEAWPEICGSMFAKYTKAQTIKDDNLIVTVKNSSMLEQMHRNKDEYLKRIYARFPHKPVKSIIFRMS